MDMPREAPQPVVVPLSRRLKNIERCHVINVMKRGQRVAQSGSSGYLIFTNNIVRNNIELQHIKQSGLFHF